MAVSENEKRYNEQEKNLELKKQKLAAKIVSAKENLEKMGLTPYAFSRLDMYLALEAWDWKDALLLLAGAIPDGANVNWEGYLNFTGVRINAPEVINVAFIDCRLPEYDVPDSYAYDNNDNYFKGDDLIERKISELSNFQNKLAKIYTFWINALEPHKEKNSPSYYIQWALTKSFKIDWLDWVIEKGFYVPKNDSKENFDFEKPLSTRTENNYLRLILSLANGIKDFNPRKPYEAAQLIIDETGIDISKQTISDYITKAYKLESQKRD